MSGILGIFYRDGRKVERKNLEQMCQTLAHRGTEGRGIWQSESVGMGHLLLQTTPESCSEQQPIVDRSGNFTITADLRLDNREELIAILDFDVRHSSEITDSQLALAAYQKWGTDCPNKLLGDFALAIWDERSQTLFCARDHYGIKQLYYYCNDSMIVFATEIKAILNVPEIPRRLNETKIADYLLTLFEDREITFYQNIWRLPPAHFLCVSDRQVRLEQYWSWNPNKNIFLGSDQEYTEAFREIFTKAVRCRMRSNHPIGTFLSGGLDSSSITYVAKNLLDRKNQTTLPTFSAIFDLITECDESPYIKAVVNSGGIEPHYIHGDRFSPLTDLSKINWHQDEAYYAPNLFLHCQIYQKAKEANVHVLLDGFDGDTTVSHGIPYLAELARSGNWLYLYLEAQGLAKNFGKSPWHWLWRHGLRPNMPIKLRNVSRKIATKTPKNNQQTKNLLLQIDFARRINLKERIARLTQGKNTLLKTSREGHYRRLTTGSMNFALEVADRAAASYGIESRYPFFDKRLIEFCLALPPEQKIYRGWTRIIMRRAMEGILPPSIQWRGDKSNLGSNFNHSLRRGQKELDSAMAEDLEYIEDYLDIPTLRSLYHRFSSGEDLSHSDHLAIWKSLSLALWLKQTQMSA